MVDTVHTITRESFAEQGWHYDSQFRSIQAPTLMLTGSETPPDIRMATEAAAAAIADVAIRVLDGHGHLAQRTDPALVARITSQFLRPYSEDVGLTRIGRPLRHARPTRTRMGLHQLDPESTTRAADNR